MEIHKVKIDSPEVTLVPLGDVQVGAEYAYNRAREHVKEGIRRGGLFLGMGDYVDVANPSSRDSLRGAKITETVREALEKTAESHIREFLRVVKGTKGLWLGVLTGHHYYEFADGSTSDTRIAKELGAPFLGTTALITLELRGTTYRILATHGEGSSKSPAAALRRIEQAAVGFEADILLSGHHHKLATGKTDRLVERDGVLVSKATTAVCTGSFMKGYVQGKETYIDKKLMTPMTLGGAILTVGEKVKVEL
jgi:hypothetical protein